MQGKATAKPKSSLSAKQRCASKRGAPRPTELEMASEDEVVASAPGARKVKSRQDSVTCGFELTSLQGKVAAISKIAKQAKAEAEPNAPPIIFKAWKSSGTKLIDGGSLAKQASQWRVDTASWASNVEIHHNDQFTLKPVSTESGLCEGETQC